VGFGKSTVTVASSILASGNTDLVTIEVKDINWNAITGLPNNAFVLGFAGGTSTGKFGTVTETSTPGTYTVLLTGVTAGTASMLTVRVEGVLLANQPKVTVVPGVVSGARSTVGFVSPTVATGMTDEVVIIAKDAAGNTIGNLPNRDFVFSLSGGTSTGSFGTVSPTTIAGVYVTVFKGASVGTASTLTLEVDGVFLSNKPKIQVT
jgi:hypothetical protein